MATASAPVSVVPEKYRGTRFRADCWYHLANHFQKKGTWLTYNEYQKVGDKTCKENVFKQVLDEMRLDVVFNKKEAVKGPDEVPQASKPEPPAPPPPPKPANPAMAQALANGLQKNAAEKPRGPVTAMRRQEATDWIKGHLDYGIAQFKHEFPEPELDLAWWEKTRKTLLHPPEESKAMPVIRIEDIHFDPRMKEDTRKVVRYLLSLSPDRIAGMTASVYMEKTKHKLEPMNFASGRKFVLALLDGSSRALKHKAAEPKAAPAAPAAPKPAAAPRETRARKAALAPTGKLFETLAEIDLTPYMKCSPADLKTFALTLVKNLHPRGAEAQVRILTDPAAMEIRVPA